MDTIRIDDEIRLTVNDDPNRVISFNPSDILFAEKFYNLIKVFEEREAEFLGRAKKLEEDKGEDGAPVNMAEAIELVKDLCAFMREQIDLVFGEGTSQAAFGDAQSLDMFEQFFEGITPFVQRVRAEKIKKYTKGKQS